MRKLFFTAVLIAFAISAVKAQIITKQVPVKKNTIIRTIPSQPEPPPAPAPASNPAPAPQPVAKQEQATITPVYTLTSARVSIRTGSDNKEFPSQVSATLMAKSNPKDWRNYIQTNLGNEMRINSDTEFGLDLEGRASTPLETFQQSGIALRIHYTPNFFADAWKIESVSLILEFKDQNGNLHPSLGRKTIVFSNAYGFLNNEFRYMKCFTDESFTPLTAVISKVY
jgi:hypothetical protein